MSYAVKQDMVDRFGDTELIQLTNNTFPATDQIRDEVLGRALNDAEAEINGYLLARYSLPLNDPPAILTVLQCDIARYRLSLQTKVTESVKSAYDDARDTLRRIAKGEMSLGIEKNQTTPAPTGGPQTSGPAPVFTDDSLEDY